MKVLADFHHEDLYESLIILFEDRLGWELYRPIGMEWWHQDFWKVYTHETTAQQFLAVDPAGEDFKKRQSLKANFRQLSLRSVLMENGTHRVPTATFPSRTYKAVTLSAFKDMKFDILLCSMPPHIPRYLKLRDQYQPQAKVIFQVGNNWSPPPSVRNFLCSSRWAMARMPAGANAVFYHQEFDADAFVSPPEEHHPYPVVSMIHYMRNKKFFLDLEQRMSLQSDRPWTFKMHGAGGREGPVGPQSEKIQEVFRKMGFLIHLKREGDGYGYNLHNAAAAGVPIICKMSHFRGMTAELLLTDGITCINIDGLKLPDIVRKLTDAAREWPAWHRRIRDRFQTVVDFDRSFQEIQGFLGRLL